MTLNTRTNVRLPVQLTIWVVVGFSLALFLATGCETDDERIVHDNSMGDSGTGGTGGTAGDTTGSTTGQTSVTTDISLTGMVNGPSGNLPIAGALVYLTSIAPPEIPNHAYEYKCDNMAGKHYTLTKADGTFVLENVSPGEIKIVTRKGNFRRVRTITITKDKEQAIPEEITQLPSSTSVDGLDTIPKFAVLLNNPDRSHDLLAKFGMGETNAFGELKFGTEQFSIYADSISKTGYPTARSLFTDQATVNQYHMLFIPCYSDLPVDFINNQTDKLRNFVAAGGKIYNSCCTSLWTEATFPEYIEFHGDDSPVKRDIGRSSQTGFQTTGKVLDSGLSDWLEVVSTAIPSSVPFQNGFVTIDTTYEVGDGHGLEEDQGFVKPYTWVSDVTSNAGSPLMVTYNYDAGKVFYSVYETSGDPTPTFTPQEHVLLYVILEIGVCQDIVVL